LLDTWEWVKNGISCTFLATFRKQFEHAVCGEVRSGFTTWTVTLGIGGATLLLCHFAAHFGGHIFQKHYLRYPHVSLKPKFTNFDWNSVPTYFYENFGWPDFREIYKTISLKLSKFKIPNFSRKDKKFFSFSAKTGESEQEQAENNRL